MEDAEVAVFAGAVLLAVRWVTTLPVVAFRAPAADFLVGAVTVLAVEEVFAAVDLAATDLAGARLAVVAFAGARSVAAAFAEDGFTVVALGAVLVAGFGAADFTAATVLAGATVEGAALEEAAALVGTRGFTISADALARPAAETAPRPTAEAAARAGFGAAVREDAAAREDTAVRDDAAARAGLGAAVRDETAARAGCRGVPVVVVLGVVAARLPVPATGVDLGFGEAFLAAGIEVFLSNDCGRAGRGGLRQLDSPVQRASSASQSALRFSAVSSARVASSAVA
ncbi:hypothetical protein [Actinoplanes sp. G11-F43]|uniref:hypothetical protein n=1 Tax=Actinoplanes sp. G11-F43 TaxID=3424130 RepID=UPI003D33E92E